MIVLSLVGPTATGKSALALELARRRGDVELVSVDSMQVYRGMDIGTAKPTPAEQQPRCAITSSTWSNPDDDYTVARFQHDLAAALDDIAARGRRAVLVGGTGLYLRAAIDDLEIPGRYPRGAGRARGRRRHRGAPPPAVRPRSGGGGPDGAHEPPAGAAGPRGHHRERAAVLVLRARAWRPTRRCPSPSSGCTVSATSSTGASPLATSVSSATGFLAEVEALAARPGGLSRTAGQALGYRELLDHLAGQSTLDEAVDDAVTRTRRFARRQERWFRRDPRLVWVPAGHNAFAPIDELLRD